MLPVRKVTFLLITLHFFLQRGSDVAAVLTTSPNSTNGVLTVCPGDFISITCTHDNAASGVTRWVVMNSTTAIICDESVNHGASSDVCGPFNIIMISDLSGPNFSSTARTTATEALNDAVVQCFSSGRPDNLVGNVTITVLSISTPTIDSVEQVSQSVVRVNMSVTDSQCVDSYQVNPTQLDSSESIPPSTSMSSSVNIRDLNVCQYNYSFEGLAISAGGISGSTSTPIGFSANLTVVNRTTVTINQVDPLIELEQIDSLYPTCITRFRITNGFNGQTITINSTTRSLDTEKLNAAGFPYCTTIQPIVTPITPMGPLETVVGIGNSTSLIDPNFPIPILSQTFTLVNGIGLRVNVQNVSELMVPTRNYQYTTNGTTSPMTSFTGDYFEIGLPGAEAGQVVTVTVVFTSGPCQSMISAAYTVPSLLISGLTQGQPTDTSQTINITLPLTEYQPEQLLIISTLEPSDDGPIMANYTSPSMQYTVLFDDLTQLTNYTFTIRIVLRSNNTVDVVPFVTGTFMTLITPTTSPPLITTLPMTTTTSSTTEPSTGLDPSAQACGIDCIVGIIVAVVFLIVLVLVVIIVICVVKHSKRSKTVKISSHEMGDQPTHKLTTADEDESDPIKPAPPSSDTFKSPTPEDTQSEGTEGASGATGGEKENLIYADLDLATKGKKHKPQDAPSPTGGTGKEEEVQYATISPAVDKKEEP